VHIPSGATCSSSVAVADGGGSFGDRKDKASRLEVAGFQVSAACGKLRDSRAVAASFRFGGLGRVELQIGFSTRMFD